MSKEINNILQFLEAKETEERTGVQAARKEIADLTRKLEELEAMQAEPDNLEEYRARAQEIRDTQDYLTYIRNKQNKEKHGYISQEEKNRITKAAAAELAELQEDAAPEILEKLYEVIELMDKYTEQAAQYESIINRAVRLYSPKFAFGSIHRACEISDKCPDKLQWFSKFVYMYYSHHDTAERIKKNQAERSVWRK